MLLPFILLLQRALVIYEWVVIASIVLHWLLYFKVVNPYQPFVRKLHEVLNRLTEPVLRRIRRFVPSVGGVDLSPIVLFLLIFFLEDMLSVLAARV